MNIDDKFQLIENKVQNSLDIFEQKIHDYTNKLNDIIESKDGNSVKNSPQLFNIKQLFTVNLRLFITISLVIFICTGLILYKVKPDFICSKKIVNHFSENYISVYKLVLYTLGTGILIIIGIILSYTIYNMKTN